VQNEESKKREIPKYSLRNVVDHDHDFLVELHNDPAVLKNITNPDPITLESHMAWWSRIQSSTTEERLIFCIDGIRAGFVKLYRMDRANFNCELGADLHKNFRGYGHAKHMWNLMLERCFRIHNMHRVSLFVADYNTIAVHLYEKLGFKVEGKLNESLLRDGIFYDQTAMYMLAKDFESYEEHLPNS